MDHGQRRTRAGRVGRVERRLKMLTIGCPPSVCRLAVVLLFVAWFSMGLAHSQVRAPDGALARADSSPATEMQGAENLLAGSPSSIGGFYEFSGGFSFRDPSHWSRAVSRLQLSANGSLGPQAKWRMGARIDADPVYASNQFYPARVRDDQKLDLSWRETYVDVSSGGWDFRLGAQNIVWGEVVGLFFADVVSARDLRDFLLPSFDVVRTPQWAMRAEHFKGDSHVELVWIPHQSFDNVGKPGSDFYPVPLPTPASAADVSIFRDPTKPARSLRNSSYGLRANTLVDGWDLAGFYYRSFSTTPTYYRVPSNLPNQPFAVQPVYDRIWQVGGTVSKDFGSLVGRAEVVYTKGRSFASTDARAPSGVLARDTVDWVLGTDITLPQDVQLNAQIFQRWYRGGQQTLAVQSGDFGASILLAAKLTARLESRVLWIQSFGGGGGLIRPRLNWTPARNTAVGVGVDVFTGPKDGFFGRYNSRDRFYTEVRRDF